MTCCRPARFAASAMARAWARSLSGEKCSQKKVTQKAPQAPAKARSRARRVIDVGRDHLGAQLGEPSGLGGVALRVRARTAEAAGRVTEDGAHEASTLRPVGSDDGDDLLVTQGVLLSTGEGDVGNRTELAIVSQQSSPAAT